MVLTDCFIISTTCVNYMKYFQKRQQRGWSLMVWAAFVDETNIVFPLKPIYCNKLKIRTTFLPKQFNFSGCPSETIHPHGKKHLGIIPIKMRI